MRLGDHRIGHELTAFYGLDHAESWRWSCHICYGTSVSKGRQIAQYAQQVWDCTVMAKRLFGLLLIK